VMGEIPGSRLATAISRFCSTDHTRRRSRRVITSICCLRALIRPVVRALSIAAAVSDPRSSFAINNTHHTGVGSRNVVLLSRLHLLRQALI
jgi:hypothetical protein